MIQPQEISHSPEYSYKLAEAEADRLAVLLAMDAQDRAKLLSSVSPDDLRMLLCQFMALAKSVEANTRSFIEQFLVIQCYFWDRDAAKINLPSLVGALHGAKMSCKPTKKMCDGCAFRQGTMANQSLITSTDALHAVRTSDRFMCHEHTDEKGTPLKACAGYASQRWATFRQEHEEAK